MNPRESEQLSRYLDGELSAREAREVEALLARSPEAREEYAIMTSLHESTQRVLPRTRFAHPHVPVRRRSRPLLRLAAAVALVLAVSGAVFGAVKVYEALTVGAAESVAPQTPPPAPEESVIPAVIAEDPEEGAPDASTFSVAEGTETAAPAGETAEEPAAPPLTGLVTDMSGNPVAGAKITARDHRGPYGYGLDENPVLAETRSDPEGRFALKWPRGADDLRILARGYQPVSVSYNGAVLARGMALRVKMLRERIYTGLVVDAAGNPIPDVRVAPAYAEDPAHASAVTDADGMFEVPGDGSALFFTHPDYALTMVERLPTLPDEPVKAVMEPGTSIRLRVMQGRSPVPGATVYAVVELPEALGYPTRRVTDDDGCVVFDRIPVADQEMLARAQVFAVGPDGAKGRLMEAPELRLGETAEAVITLPEDYPGTVNGTVTDAEGAPMPGVSILVADSSGVYRSVETNADGVYNATLPFGKNQILLRYYMLSAGLYTEEPLRICEVGAAGQTFAENFTLKTVSKAITFVNADGSPLEELWLSMWPPLHHRDDHANWRVATDDGRIEVRVNEIRGGSAYDPESACWTTFAVAEDQFSLTVVVDKPAGALAGRVVDPDGNPLAEASVGALSSGRNVWTSDDGRFRMEPLAMSLAWDLRIDYPGYQLLPGAPAYNLQAARDPEVLEYVMGPQDDGVYGQVVASDGSPLAWAHVSIVDDRRILKRTSTSNDGGFFFRVAEGAYTVWVVTRDLGAIQSVPVTAPSQGDVVTLPVPPQNAQMGTDKPKMGPEHERASNNLKQMGLVFKMYANESAGEVFPPLEVREDAFTPAFKEIYPEYLTDPKVLFPENGVTSCYFGHAVTSEAQGLAFLDACAQLGMQAVSGQDIRVGAGKGTAGGDTIYRLSEDLQQRAFPDMPENIVGVPVQALVPILWEIPGDREESGGWVLYMDGHVQWLPYPGPFPMTERFVTRLRARLGL